jgi:hypothetical protein
MTDAQQTSRESEALAKLKVAEADLALAQENVQAYVNQNFRAVAGGLIIHTVYKRDEVEADLRALLQKVDATKLAFHSALKTWADTKDAK